MNMIEKQAELGRSLYEINTSVLKELAMLQRKNVETYFETNRSFGEKLPEVKSVEDFMALQREYGESLWTNARSAVETQGEIVRSAFEETASALRTAFTFDADVAKSAPKPGTKAKATTRKAKAANKKPVAETN